MVLPPGLIKQLRRIVGKKHVETGLADCLVFESDALPLHSARPDCVVYPATTDECAQVVMVCSQAGVPFVPRGAGTGLSGGAVSDGGVIIQLSRLNQVLAMNPDDSYAIVQPGVTNQQLSLLAQAHGLDFAPDPSSEVACTIGGNVAEDAGGPHTLKYGVTSNHVLGQTVIFPNGELATLGGPFPVISGPSFSTFLAGTEGTIAITAEIIVRLVPSTPSKITMLAIYREVAAATDAVSAILTSGVLPAALEMIDYLCIQAVEAHIKAGFPTDAAAVLLIELDGEESLMQRDAEVVAKVCKSQGAVAFHTAVTEEERLRLWQGRKHAAGALGKIARAFYTNDGVVPRSRLTDIYRAIYRIGEEHGLQIGSICHAGDGLIHPQILFDPDDPQGSERAMACSKDIQRACLEMGGSITGEHGVGMEKREQLRWMFSDSELAHMRRLRDEFNPDQLLNRNKVFPGNDQPGHTGSKESGKLPEKSDKRSKTAIDWPEPGGNLQPGDRSQVGALIQAVRTSGVNIGSPDATYHWDFSQLKQVVAFHAPDMILTAETGITLSTVKQVVESEKLWLPLDSPEGDLTLADYLAGDHSLSWLSHRYCTVRDWIVELIAVSDQGYEVKSGARVVKNVAGYRLAPLYIGARNALGPIVQVSFRLLPLPLPLTIVRCQAEEPDPLLAVWKHSRQNSHPAGRGEPWEALRLECRERQWQLEGMTRFQPEFAASWCASENGISKEITVEDNAPLRECRESPALNIIRIQVLPTQVPELLLSLHSLSLDLTCYPAAGVVHLKPLSSQVNRQSLESLLAELAAGGGKVQSLATEPLIELPEAVASGAENAIMSRVKKAFDLDGVFGPLPLELQ